MAYNLKLRDTDGTPFLMRLADNFIQKNLCDGDTLFVSFHMGKQGVRGFLDDYAAYIFAQLSLYRATLESEYMKRANHLCDKVITDFSDNMGGFYLYGKDHEELIFRPKETYDGAIPSGNSLMAYNLVLLSFLTDEEKYKTAADRHLDFLGQNAAQYPTNHAMFLTAFLKNIKPPMKITVVTDQHTDKRRLPLVLLPDSIIILLPYPTKEYPLKNGKTTYYMCRGQSCLPPTNNLSELL